MNLSRPAPQSFVARVDRKRLALTLCALSMSQHHLTAAFAGQTECTETLLTALAVVSLSKQGRGPVASVKKTDPLSAKSKGIKAAPGKSGLTPWSPCSHCWRTSLKVAPGKSCLIDTVVTMQSLKRRSCWRTSLKAAAGKSGLTLWSSCSHCWRTSLKAAPGKSGLTPWSPCSHCWRSSHCWRTSRCSRQEWFDAVVTMRSLWRTSKWLPAEWSPFIVGGRCERHEHRCAAAYTRDTTLYIHYTCRSISAHIKGCTAHTRGITLHSL